MEQIRQDMKRHKRLLSVDTETSERNSVAVRYEDGVLVEGDTEIIDNGDGKHDGEDEDTTDYLLSETNHEPRFEDYRPVRDDVVNADLSRGMSNISIDSQGMLDQFPAPPIVYITSEDPSVCAPQRVSIVTTTLMFCSLDRSTYPSCPRQRVHPSQGRLDALRLFQHCLGHDIDGEQCRILC